MAAKRTRFLGIGRLADEHNSYGAVGTALQYCCDWRRRQHRQYDQLVELRQAEPCRQPASGKSHGSTSLQYVQHHELWGALGTYRLAKRRPYFEPGDVAAATAVGREDRFLSSKAG